MRRIALVLIIFLVLICPPIFATRYEMDNVSQMLIGYVGVETQLYLGIDDSLFDPETGINLDINDSGNRNKFLIAPSPGELGLRIGHFTFIAQAGTSGTITISHTALKTANDVTLDYELGVSYTIGSTPVTSFCNSSSNYGADGKKVDINLADWVNAVYIKDGGLHFRLITPPETQGDYTSTITVIFTEES